MEVSSNCLSDPDQCPTTNIEKCSEMKLTKSTKLFSIESIIANTNKDSNSIGAESPVTQENYYCPQSAAEYPVQPPSLLPPVSHYGNIYNNAAWFGGLFNAHFTTTTNNNHHPEKDLLPFPNFAAFANAPSPDPPQPRVPLMFNDPNVINAYQREKLAQYFMNSLRSAGGVGPGECDKLTELIFRTSSASSGGYAGVPLLEGYNLQEEKSRSPFHEHHRQQGSAKGPPSEELSPVDQRHLSSAIIGCLPLMSKQIQGGSEIHQQQQQQQHLQHHPIHSDKGMMDTASNDSCSDDLSLTLSPGESSKHRGERERSGNDRLVGGQKGQCLNKLIDARMGYDTRED